VSAATGAVTVSKVSTAATIGAAGVAAAALTAAVFAPVAASRSIPRG